MSPTWTAWTSTTAAWHRISNTCAAPSTATSSQACHGDLKSAECDGDFAVSEREHVGGLPRLDSDRRDEEPLGAIRSPLIRRSSSLAASYPVRWVLGITLVSGGVVRLHRSGSLSTPITAISSGTAFNTIPAQQLDRNIRTLPSDFAELRLDPVNTLNVALVKNTSIAKTTLQLRAETFNAFDRVQFNAPVTAATSSDFGRITSQANAPRSVQFAVRLMW